KITLPLSILFLTLLLVAVSMPACSAGAPEDTGKSITPSAASDAGRILAKRDRVKVATTTSLYDTGLWGFLEPMFEKKYNVELDVLYAGTGKAIEYGTRGDVDVLTIHDKAREEKLVADGIGVKRVPFASNHFIITGPPSDPAGIKGMSPEAAFKTLMEKGKTSPQQVQFISRGDNSGTHSKEKAIWKAAGYEYEDVTKSGPWYVEAGSGMGPTLVMAKEKSAYTVADIGTFLAYKGKLGLASLVDRGAILLNVYSVIPINPDKVPGTNLKMAENMVDFLTSPEIQTLIGKYGADEYGEQLFTPSAGAEPVE
ncbi:MAG: substrate-binding domain-containing protein, partial [Dehalococcoidia bacterium]|nr:substrate-binding domain-containing protein [Dehalococcoidia bacterium]